jgi:arginyl-tRNA synthetase
MRKDLVRILEEALKRLGVKTLTSIEIEAPRQESMGDLATPVAMLLTKSLKKPPRKIAEDIVNAIEDKAVFEKIEIAGPGFVNFTFSKEYLYSGLKDLLKLKGDFLRCNIGKGRHIQIEFVSANPTGPLHLGHGKGAATGAALSNLLCAAGYRVDREYYINDAGKQVKLLGLSVFARYQQLHDVEYPFPEDGYKGAYIEDIAREIMKEKRKKYIQAGFEEVSDVFIDYSYQKILSGIKDDLKSFGVDFDIWQSERELFDSGKVENAIDDLKEKGHMGDRFWR